MPDARAVDVPGLVAQARAGRARAVGRLISLIESASPTEGASPALREVTAALLPWTGSARVIGLTGPPGVGKSTITAALIGEFRRLGHRVGVLAVDPSSPFSGGALLGDRIRMQEHAVDPGVFIRSMASRGHLGGLARSAPQALRVLDAAGFDVVLLETVGVGQSEVEVAGLADTTVVLLAPGMGDGIQAAKAGVLEIGDVFVVNQADRDGAPATVRDLRHMLTLAGQREPGDWRPPVVAAVARTGRGVDDVVTALGEHDAWLRGSGALAGRRRRRAAREIEAIALAELRQRLGGLGPGSGVSELATRVVDRALDPYAAAAELLEALAEREDG